MEKNIRIQMYEADRVDVVAGELHLPADPTQGGETYV